MASQRSVPTPLELHQLIRELDGVIEGNLVEYAYRTRRNFHWLARAAWSVRKHVNNFTAKVQCGFVEQVPEGVPKYRWWIPNTGRTSINEGNVSVTLAIVTEGADRGLPIMEIDPPFLGVDASAFHERMRGALHALHPEWALEMHQYGLEGNPGRGCCIIIQPQSSEVTRAIREQVLREQRESRRRGQS